jgi:hypothetical protein
MARRTGLNFEITDEDIAYARRKNRWNCAAVRAIQRTLPEATHVMVDAEHIRFSLASENTRYEFQTPKSMVTGIIKPFDEEGDTPDRSFTLPHAVDAWDMKKTNRAEIIEKRAKQRETGPRRNPPREGHHNSAFNRFDVITQAIEESGAEDQQ